MYNYSERRFYDYQDVLNKPGSGNLFCLLPPKLKNILISSANSFLVNGYGGKNLNMLKFKNLNLPILYRSTQFISQEEYNSVFQIVVIGDDFYINPWFEQPAQLLFKDYFVIGRYKESKRSVLYNVSKLFANRIFKPHHNSVCVIGAARVPPTVAHQEAIDRGNVIISIDDYVKLLKESSLGIYI